MIVENEGSDKEDAGSIEEEEWEDCNDFICMDFGQPPEISYFTKGKIKA